MQRRCCVAHGVVAIERRKARTSALGRRPRLVRSSCTQDRQPGNGNIEVLRLFAGLLMRPKKYGELNV